jgi:hypothetical protein
MRRALDVAQRQRRGGFQNARMIRRRMLLAAALAAALAGPSLAQPPATPAELAAEFHRAVDRRLQIPADEVAHYARLTEDAFARAGVVVTGAQYLVVVDRDPQVQAVLVLWRSAAGAYALVGAAPVSTGRPGTFDHFETPLGVFEHTLANPDFRAEGTFNENGIRGYGVKGMRVFDFGWQRVPKGWGDGQVIEMRLQMHATDPDALERRLGTVQSKGCIRIPATLDRFLDLHGVLDADYERALREGDRLWMLDPEAEPVADAGRYLVVVDSDRAQRPDWSQAPPLPHRAPPPPPHFVPKPKAKG